jgi:hypothetical protein
MTANSTLKRLVAATAILVAITTATRAQTPPPNPPRELAEKVGDYVLGSRVVYVSEVGGELRIRTNPFTSHKLDEIDAEIRNKELRIGDTRYLKRDVAQGTFRIQPRRPVAELRNEALAANPPTQPDSLLKPDPVELRSLEPGIRYDIRYATTNNFMSAVFYTQPRAFLQRPAAEAVVRAHRKLNALGY